MRYCESPYVFKRRQTREVVIGDPANGGVIVGGNHPVVAQSMITCDTMDTVASVKQTLDLVAVGCQLVRITAPTVKDAANLQNIVTELRKQGCNVPIVADIHFKPEAAMEAVKWVEVIRVNPGNYADSKKFAIKEYTDDQYAEELRRIEEKFTPLVLECLKLKRAMRIGTNHGSLSDRIMNRYGDTPLGMVESALEFARICRKHDFHNFKFSMKSSNPKVMIECYRLLVARLEQEGPDWNYPIHLGVTEAGEGEDGRIKSAIGIGSLLCDGLGDTIRVSLTEDSPREIEVCRDLLAQIPLLANTKVEVNETGFPFDPFHFEKRETPEIELNEQIKCGGEQLIRVVVTRRTWDKVAPKIRSKDDVKPEAVYEDLNVAELDPTQDFDINCDTQLVTVKDGVNLPTITAFRLLAAKLKRLGRNNPILLKDCLAFETTALEPKIALLRASVVIGALLADGIGDAILVRGEAGGGQSLRLAYNILQAAGCRSFKTDYVACPSCGRTLFNLQTVTARIKARTEHLKGVKIAIMGCIVNGPGEMADADFGYVGGAPGKINLYVGKTPIKFNIPEAEAVERLVDLIKEHNKWVDRSKNRQRFLIRLVMADSKIQAQAENWIRETWLPKRFKQAFNKGRLSLASGGLFEFDAISQDKKLIASISTNGGITAAGRKATPKLNKVRSDILFLLLSEASQRLVLLTDKSMFELCEQERKRGRMPQQIEFIHAALPPDLEEQCKAARHIAAQEQGYKKSAIKPPC